MRRSPEKEVELYYFKCRIKDCPLPYGIMQTSLSEAERNWFHHSRSLHIGKVREIPPYVIRKKWFEVTKEESR